MKWGNYYNSNNYSDYNGHYNFLCHPLIHMFIHIYAHIHIFDTNIFLHLIQIISII
jgi:hypothetical protein